MYVHTYTTYGIGITNILLISPNIFARYAPPVGSILLSLKEIYYAKMLRRAIIATQD